ncbi:MAG: hypothetical protein ACRDB1_14715 [Microcoleaceae cyanobacterium]
MEKSKEEHDDIKVRGPISVKAEESKIIVEIGEEKKPKPPKKDAPGTKILLCFLAIALLIIAVIDGGVGFKANPRPSHQPDHPSPR